jgi:hypothetical protein
VIAIANEVHLNFSFIFWIASKPIGILHLPMLACHLLISSNASKTLTIQQSTSPISWFTHQVQFTTFSFHCLLR